MKLPVLQSQPILGSTRKGNLVKYIRGFPNIGKQPYVQILNSREPSYPVIPGSYSSPTSPFCTDSSEQGSATPIPLERNLQPHPQMSPNPEMT